MKNILFSKCVLLVSFNSEVEKIPYIRLFERYYVEISSLPVRLAFGCMNCPDKKYFVPLSTFRSGRCKFLWNGYKTKQTGDLTSDGGSFKCQGFF